MFEEEIEFDKKQGGGFGPLIVIVAMITLLVGGIGWFVWQNAQTVKPDQAAKYLTASFIKQGPAVVRFHTGLLTANVNDKLEDPHYKLLEKAGIITIKKEKNQDLQVDLTEKGEKMIAGFPELKKVQNSDGTVAYTVPLATKELLKVEKVTKVGTGKVEVVYTWKWKPNELGNVFDASNPDVKSFSTWDRSVLIDKYGAEFYNADPKKSTIFMVKPYNGDWEPSKG